MTGVDPEIAEHHLNIPPDSRPVKQKARRQAPDRQRAIQEEVDRLLAAGFIEEAKYPQWLSNIDQLVDATAGHARLSFMDAYSGYNQIRMVPGDREHTTFLTNQGMYFYKVMSFELKNAGATYQRTCAFGVTSGKFLGFIVHERGIDANPEKVQAIINMQSPRTVKDLQRLNGRLVALSRFLARSGDRCLPFFKALKSPKSFQWTSECEEAFKQIKQHMASLPRLASVSPGEKLGLYLAASQHAVSSVLVKESSGQQLPIYCVSHVLSGPEERRLLKWAVELGEHDISYSPRTAIKAQVVADFIAELTQLEDGAGAGLVLLAPDGRSFERSLHFGFKATNNEAEYEALLAGLELALEMQVAAIRVLTDSQLVAEQLNGGYEARDVTMAKHLARVRDLTAKFHYFTLSNIPREENERADALAKLALKSISKAWPEVEELPAHAVEIATTAPGGVPTTWVQELLRFKRDGTLPLDEVAARHLHHTHAWYTVECDHLYKRSFTYPLLRCLEPDEAQMVLTETHEGVCGEHIGGQTLAHKILRQGYYWATMCQDAKAYVRRCSSCQQHARAPRQLAVPLSPIDCTWPFAQWGLDLLGPFPPASGQRKYIIVGVDYFMKWVEC
ncbi:uncharacterized protein LOC135680425 [Musa acuminata AAA Group]|uniref:uncharacterized protein LOC135680425 n=1 Tax=Musa acuminata AAA Group TaxID=214697 RepID=UPI0031D238C1